MALAQDGVKDNILVNTISPVAGTNMSRTIMPEALVQRLKPEFVAPLVLLLCSDQAPQPCTGCLYEVGGCYVVETRMERSRGYETQAGARINPEILSQKWEMVQELAPARAGRWALGDPTMATSPSKGEGVSDWPKSRI